MESELPNHFAYMFKFRVEQCPLFLQHKCTQHRPFTCFHWHFQNQRRRKPIRRRDGSLNYSADEYCTKYDETTGICPDGDECSFLHRTAGDTERRYHLRYYKTAPCVHETDNRGFCIKNGVHCAFSHGNSDLRNPIYDLLDLNKAGEKITDLEFSGQNALDKERNLLNDDPKWQDTNYVLANYKTESCKKPPRLCRQGYACPQYHNTRDRRRSPKKFKYRSTPCPNAKHGEEWADPSGCDSGDSCQYCHTRTEQQFHPEIYKSTKCHDMQTNSYCPRGSFCAFAHGDFEAREFEHQDGGTNLAELLLNAFPSMNAANDDNIIKDSDARDSVESPTKWDHGKLDIGTESSLLQASSSVPICNRLQSLEADEILASSGPMSTTLSSFGQLPSHSSNKIRSLSVPGADLNLANIYYSNLDKDEWDPLSNFELFREQSDTRKLNLYGGTTLGNLLPQLQPAAYFPTGNARSNSIVLETNGSALVGAVKNVDEKCKSNREYEAEQPSLCESIAMGVASSGLLSGPGSAPVNIPRAGLDRHPLSLTPSPPSLNLSLDTRVSSEHHINIDAQMNSMNFSANNKVGSYSNGVSFLDHWGSPSCRGISNVNVVPHSPLLRSGGIIIGESMGNNELQRMKQEASSHQKKVNSLEEDLSLARRTCEAWRTKAIIAEQQRDEVALRLVALQQEMKLLRESHADKKF